MITKWTIGSDPEFGAVNEAGVVTSCIGKIPGNKREPSDIGNGCGVQIDNVMCELTIPPTDNKKDFVNYMMYGKNKINEMLNEHGLSIKSLSSARYSSEELNNDIAKQFGCDPSYCIYTKSESVRPSAKQVGNLRSAGTHIHIGVNRLLSIPEIEYLINCMDRFLGIPSIIIDQDTERRKLYGNAGDFRFKTITDPELTIVEYRTLGGIFTDTQELIEYLYDQTEAAVAYFNATYVPEININTSYRVIIDNGDVDAAKKFCTEHKINLVNVNQLVHA